MTSEKLKIGQEMQNKIKCMEQLITQIPDLNLNLYQLNGDVRRLWEGMENGILDDLINEITNKLEDDLNDLKKEFVNL